MAFRSIATNLVPGDTNNALDVFVHDRSTGTTERVSVDSSGNQLSEGGFSPTISGDGRSVAFYTPSSDVVPDDTNGMNDVFVHDRETGLTVRASVDSSGA